MISCRASKILLKEFYNTQQMRRTKVPTKIAFVLGYKLPWISEAVMTIYNYAPGGSLKDG